MSADIVGDCASDSILSERVLCGGLLRLGVYAWA